MSTEKLILLFQAKVPPQHRAEILEAARQYLPLVRAEAGVEAFYQTAREDDPNTLVFFEVYSSQAAHEFHLQQEYTKKFLATFKSRLAEELVRTKLLELG